MPTDSLRVRLAQRTGQVGRIGLDQFRTGQENKRKALRNAVLNSALSASPDVTRQQVFLSLIDRLTDLHLSILQLFHGPNDWKASDGRRLSGRNKADAGEVLTEAYPELLGHESLCGVLWGELHTAGLVDIATLHNRHGARR